MIGKVEREKIEKKRKRWEFFSASYTIEASFVFPIIIAVMIAVLFLGFYLYDYTVINITTYEMACHGAENLKTVKEIEDYGHRILDNRLFATEVERMDISISNKRVQVILEGKFINPIFPEKMLEWKGNDEIVVKKSVPIAKASDSVRKVHVLIEKLEGLWEE